MPFVGGNVSEVMLEQWLKSESQMMSEDKPSWFS